MWSGTGLKIDLDNLLISRPKSVQTSSAPSMNQMAQENPLSPSHPRPSTSSSSSAAFTAGPNYNVNTASLVGSGAMGMPTRPQPMGMTGGMGMSGGMGMGMGMTGGMGMGMAGGMGMGYGGYGARPGVMPMYGVMGQPPGMGMGYGVMPSSVGGNQPMGTQQKLM